MQWIRRHWIPPAGLVAGQTAHGLSWIFLFVLATRRPFAAGMPALAWLHLVVLGWLTMTALTILIHVIPTFTEVPWKGERLARGSLLLYAIGVVGLVAAFWTESASALPWAGAAIVAALTLYAIPAGRTLAVALAGPRVEAAIARALTITLASLSLAALLGEILALALSGRAPSSLLSYAPRIHASFGLIGWLTVLVMGVSTRTVRPLTGVRSRFVWAHIAAASLEIVGLLGIVTGSLLDVPDVTWFGFIAVLVGLFLYVGDVADILRRSTVTHRPPQAFAGAAVLWLVLGLATMLATQFRETLAAAAIYIFVMGWIGQMVNGHLYHIGIRLIATIARGEDDETQPKELLSSSLSWTSFAFFQGAVATGGVALIVGIPTLLAIAALSGCFGWVAMVGNVILASRRAYSILTVE